jgi:hypothetical protein
MAAKKLQELGKWKVGQTVCVKHRDNVEIDIISRITDGRGGTLYLTNSEKSFDLEGLSRGKTNCPVWGRYTYISEVNKQEIENIKTNSIRTSLSKINWHEVSNEKILQINEFLKHG